VAYSNHAIGDFEERRPITPKEMKEVKKIGEARSGNRVKNS